ncbi:MAG: V-type ATP synthase subunit D [Methanoregulaceae archaeon]|jgi:V/A-type H+-transporting ATPase subunit D|nr:V-type ATP synthase subunit D [Methanoregulaceae archaeon]MCU0628456.1 V-type ATP synthase subunit D [Methanoregulaceae archaeon]
MKIKLTQGELKKQRDALRQYERYLPTLQLKKQQIQLEILHQQSALRERERVLSEKKRSAKDWSGLLSEAPGIKKWLKPQNVITGKKNIAGVDIPVFEHLVFETPEYDLFLTPLWLDSGLSALRDMVSLLEEIHVIEKGISVLNHELRITTQRVNLFEKVKIPGAKEAIRLIKIYIGDQMTNAVGRSKIAKNKIEETGLEEVAL